MSETIRSVVREFAVSFDGPRFIATDAKGFVTIWDANTYEQVAAFQTAFDAGGRRLAINSKGDRCVALSWGSKGLWCYDTSNGATLGSELRLKELQIVSFSPDDKRLYVCSEQGPCRVLDARTGSQIQSYPNTDDIYCSPFQPLELLCKRRRKICEIHGEAGGDLISTVEHTRDRLLTAAFAPDRLCISESGGPVRCIDTKTGTDLWRYDSPGGGHFVWLAFSPRANAFFGVKWPLGGGTPMGLFRFETESGKASEVMTFPHLQATVAFCQSGNRLITSEGDFIDTSTGDIIAKFGFPLRS